MSLHEIFDYVWNAHIPWLWIIGILGGVWMAWFVVLAIIARAVGKEGRNVKKS